VPLVVTLMSWVVSPVDQRKELKPPASRVALPQALAGPVIVGAALLIMMACVSLAWQPPVPVTVTP
jgi:hypothetical protein